MVLQIINEYKEMKIKRIVGGNRIKRSSDLRRQLLGFRPTRKSATLLKAITWEDRRQQDPPPYQWGCNLN